MKKRITIDRTLLAAVAATLISMALGATGARASSVDFGCAVGPPHMCTGTVSASAGTFTTTGIDVFNETGDANPYPPKVPFVLAFDTSTDMISIDGTGPETGEDLMGKITGFTTMSLGNAAGLFMTVSWTSLPDAVQDKLGTLTGNGVVSVLYLKSNGAAQSVDSLITPIPEPATLTLLGTGLIGLAGLLRRKIRS